MPIGQVSGAHWILSTLSISSSSSIGARPSRSSLLTKVMMGVSRSRHTSMSLMVRSSTPLAQSMTIKAESTAVSVRYVSSEKSSWPGVSNRLTTQSSNGNCITEEVTEMPRCCSRRIQSEVACRVALRPLTVPAIWMAPPNRSNFSVSVVLPASGCDMMANVLRRLISFDISASVPDQFLEHVHGYVHRLQSTCCHEGPQAASARRPGALSLRSHYSVAMLMADGAYRVTPRVVARRHCRVVCSLGTIYSAPRE